MDNVSNQLTNAAKAGKEAEVRKLLKLAAMDLDYRDEDGFTALMLAARSGHTKIAKILVLNGADILAESREGEFANIIAVRHGHVTTANEIVKAKLAFNEKSSTRKTPSDVCTKETQAQKPKKPLKQQALKERAPSSLLIHQVRQRAANIRRLPSAS